MKGFLLGAGALVLLIAVGLGIGLVATTKPLTTLSGYIGTEKTAFLQDPQVVQILKDRYHLALSITGMGSLEMVAQAPPTGMDFLWPSSQIPRELFQTQFPTVVLKSEVLLASPLVLYSWDVVTTALEKNGYIHVKDGVAYFDEFPAFYKRISGKAKWADLGLTQLYGTISITSTDPLKSNSGMLFASLLAQAAIGDLSDEKSLQKILPEISAYFSRLGYLQASTGTLFEDFLRSGMGQYPLICGYENQITEFAAQNPGLWAKVRTHIKILYPAPTIWSEHPLMTLTPAAGALIAGLKDPEIQKIAWEVHGFRTQVAGSQSGDNSLGALGIPAEITQVIPAPRSATVVKLLAALPH